MRFPGRATSPSIKQLARHAFLICLLALSLVATSIAEDRGSKRRSKSVDAPAGDTAKQKLDVVAHWRFQKGISGSSANSSQLIEDLSGNSRHGRAVGGPRYVAVDHPAEDLALAFDGRDDRIAVSDHSVFHLTKSFTIEAWINIAFYPASRQNRSFITFRGDQRAGFDPWYLGLEESGQLAFQIADSINKTSIVLSPKPLPTRKRLHVAAVLNHETGKQSLYVNGKHVASIKTKIRAGGPLGGRGPGIGIGGRQDHSHQGYTGSIAELRITAEALAPSQFLLRTAQ